MPVLLWRTLAAARAASWGRCWASTPACEASCLTGEEPWREAGRLMPLRHHGAGCL